MALFILGRGTTTDDNTDLDSILGNTGGSG